MEPKIEIYRLGGTLVRRNAPGTPPQVRRPRKVQIVFQSPPPPPRVGLGDWVDYLAKPIARWIDAQVLPRPALVRDGRLVRRAACPADPALAMVVAVAVRCGLVTLPLAGCSACSKRRKWLNDLVPVVLSWRAWLGLCRRLLGLGHSVH